MMNIKSIHIQNEQETRAGFGDGLFELAQQNSKVIALTADLSGSFKLNNFIKHYPHRFLQCGIAEANMMGVAAGLTIGGWIPYTTTFAVFSTGRVYDQIRQSIAYSEKPVKICASHAGVTLGEDGATHQILEDIGLMKMIPGMTIIVPCDYNQTKIATIAIANYPGPVYLRFGRPKWPNFTNTNGNDFTIGKAQTLIEGSHISLFACGHLVWNAIEAAKQLQEKGIEAEVINIHTIKPIDEESIVKSIKKTGCAVTCEEHNIWGGLGESIARISTMYHPVPIMYIGTNDCFGESGPPLALLEKYQLSPTSIVEKALQCIQKK